MGRPRSVTTPPAPLREITPLPGVSTREDFEVKRGNPDAPGAPDTQIQNLPVAPLAAVGGVGFDGVGEGNAQFALQREPRAARHVGEAGLTQFVQWVNPSFAIFDKATGNLLYGPGRAATRSGRASAATARRGTTAIRWCSTTSSPIAG